jgi:hypothetical protein
MQRVSSRRKLVYLRVRIIRRVMRLEEQLLRMVVASVVLAIAVAGAID